jgi:hypothetical protein
MLVGWSSEAFFPYKAVCEPSQYTFTSYYIFLVSVSILMYHGSDIIMATVLDITIPDASPLWRLWQWARGLEGSHITLPDADLRGKWIIITGGNNGIGREAALRFASWGASIVLGCRPPPLHETHPDVTVADCVTAARAAGHESSKIEWWPCDMSDLSTVEAFAKRWLSTGHALDVLANNAGMGRTVSGKLTSTRDGFEIVHQVMRAPGITRCILSEIFRSTSSHTSTLP